MCPSLNTLTDQCLVLAPRMANRFFPSRCTLYSFSRTAGIKIYKMWDIPPYGRLVHMSIRRPIKRPTLGPGCYPSEIRWCCVCCLRLRTSLWTPATGEVTGEVGQLRHMSIDLLLHLVINEISYQISPRVDGHLKLNKEPYTPKNLK